MASSAERHDEGPFSARLLRKPPIKFQSQSAILQIAPAENSTRSSAAFYRGVVERKEQASKEFQASCQTCGLIIPCPPNASETQIEQARLAHIRTTAHLASLPPPPKVQKTTAKYPIPRGSMLLQKHGWDPRQASGLGKMEQGIKEPIKATRIKNDSLGLGTRVATKPTGKQKVIKPWNGKIMELEHKRDKRKRLALFRLL